MPKKRFSAEQVVTLLRQIEVLIAQGKSAPVSNNILCQRRSVTRPMIVGRVRPRSEPPNEHSAIRSAACGRFLFND